MTVRIKKSLVGKPEPEGVNRCGQEMADWMRANGQCAEYVRPRDGWTRGHLCGRAITDHARCLCSVHKGIATRKENEAKDRAALRKRSEDNLAKGKRLAKALNRLAKTDAEAEIVTDWRGGYRYTGGIVLSAKDAEAVIALLKGE
jgi:hypothetical protein